MIVSELGVLKEFEVFEFCHRVVRQKVKTAEDLESRLKEVAHNNTIGTEQAMEVLVVELRDSALRLLDHQSKSENFGTNLAIAD